MHDRIECVQSGNFFGSYDKEPLNLPALDYNQRHLWRIGEPRTLEESYQLIDAILQGEELDPLRFVTPEDFHSQMRHYVSQKDIIIQQLKQKFVGLDEVIDKVAPMVAAWAGGSYLFQTRPLVICLWGLTGTGKTALVQSLASDYLSAFPFVQIDIGEAISSSGDKFIQNFKSNAQRLNKKPGVILIDDIQKIKRLETSSQIDAIWALLNDGRLNERVQGNALSFLLDVEDLLTSYHYMEKMGVKNFMRAPLPYHLQRAREYLGSVYFNTEDEEDNPEKVETPFLPAPLPWFVLRVAEVLNIPEYLWEILQRKLSYNPPAILRKIRERLLDMRESTVYLDLSKCLIFVTGNVDESFEVAASVSLEESPDIVSTMVKSVQVTNVLSALSLYFSPEQVARFGNNHILFPALTTEHYTTLIYREAALLQEKYASMGIKLEFDDTLPQIIFKEGVRPAQGVRSVLSAFQRLVATPLQLAIGKAFSQIPFPVQGNLSFKISFETQGGDPELVCTIERDGSNIEFRESLIFVTSGGAIHETITLHRDIYYPLAIHEAGHVIGYYALFRIIPIKVSIVSRDEVFNGFLLVPPLPEPLTHQQCINMATVFLCGRAAEELFLGREHMTAGVQKDIALATKQILRVYCTMGLQDIALIDKRPERLGACFYTSSDDATVRRILQQCYQKAKELVCQGQHREVIHQLAEALLQNATLDEAVLRKYLSQLDASSETKL